MKINLFSKYLYPRSDVVVTVCTRAVCRSLAESGIFDHLQVLITGDKITEQSFIFFIKISYYFNLLYTVSNTKDIKALLRSSGARLHIHYGMNFYEHFIAISVQDVRIYITRHCLSSPSAFPFASVSLSLLSTVFLLLPVRGFLF